MSIWDIFKKKGSDGGDTGNTGGENTDLNVQSESSDTESTDISGSASNAPANVENPNPYADRQQAQDNTVQQPMTSTTQPNQEVQVFAEGKFGNGQQPAVEDDYKAGMKRQMEASLKAEQEMLAERKRIPNPNQQPLTVTTQENNGTVDPNNYTFTEQELAEKFPEATDQLPSSQTTEQSATNQQSQNGQQQQATGPDWSQGFMKVIEGGYDGSIMQGIQEYNKWAAANGQAPLDAFTTYPLLQKYDATKSLEQNKKDEKRMKRQETWQQIGSVLSHVGNLVGTIMGAPEQKLMSGTELTDRQLKLRDYTLQQRRQGLGDLMNLYYKDRADQRAGDLNRINIEYKQQQAALAKEKGEREKELAILQQERVKAQTAGDQARAAQLEADVKKKEAEIERINRLVPSEIAKNEAAAGASRASAAASYARANATNKANEDWIDEAEKWGDLYPDEYAEWKKQNQIETGKRGTKGIDKKNPEVFVKRMRTKHGTIQKARQSKTNNTPPSRRMQTNNSNVPPSRRK